MNNIFTTEQVNKYFNILSKLDRYCQRRYPIKGSEYGKCEQDVFVQRTLNKWFKDRSFKFIQDVSTGFYLSNKTDKNLWSKSEEITLKVYCYASIANISYHAGYGNYIKVVLYDATKPYSLSTIKIDHNKALNLLGEEITKDELNYIKGLFEAKV